MPLPASSQRCAPREPEHLLGDGAAGRAGREPGRDARAGGAQLRQRRRVAQEPVHARRERRRLRVRLDQLREGAPLAAEGGAVSIEASALADRHARFFETELASGRAILGSSAPASSDETVLDPFKLDIIYGVGEVQIPLDEIVDRFQAGVQDQVSDDAESQYALGVSFLEMGLPEQAMEALRSSADDPQLRGRASELVGRCLMDLGRFEEAVAEFRTTLADPKLDSGTMLGVRFELGLALEAAGRSDEALAEFERVHQARPSYPEAATKIRSLRQSLESR